MRGCTAESAKPAAAAESTAPGRCGRAGRGRFEDDGRVVLALLVPRRSGCRQCAQVAAIRIAKEQLRFRSGGLRLAGELRPGLLLLRGVEGIRLEDLGKL